MGQETGCWSGGAARDVKGTAPPSPASIRPSPDEICRSVAVLGRGTLAIASFQVKGWCLRQKILAACYDSRKLLFLFDQQLFGRLWVKSCESNVHKTRRSQEQIFKRPT